MSGIDAFLATVRDPTVTGIGRLPMRSPGVPYPDLDGARSDDPSASPWWTSLDGTWSFALLERPEDLTAEHLTGADRGWDRITVPGAWTLQGPRGGGRYDRPHYTNVVMPFDADPPGIPERNPTGVYRRTVTVPKAWAGRRVVLRLGAAESVAAVWVDGELAGTCTDSRLPTELDVTGLVRPGRRATIAIAVARWSAHSWIEDQDQWWHGGIQRSVSLHSTAPTHLADVGLVPGLAEDGTGLLDVEVTVEGPGCREPGWTVEVHVEPLRGRGDRPPRVLATTGPADVPVWDASSEAAQVLSGMFVRPGIVATRLEVRGVRPWTHETPNRYRVVTTLRSPDGDTVEVTSRTTGFRSVEVRDRELLVNGRPVLLHGVNLHEHDPATGRAVDRELTRRDLLMMKAHHLNAVRAAHYPHDEHLAELCDELGLYLVDEANVESHARQTSLCHDPRYAPAMVERVERMVRRDRHHPSIIMWSLGNESGDGPPHAAAAALVRRIDPSRPLHYEGPLMHDLHAPAPETDVVCPMYPTIDAIVEWATSGADARRPLIMCEYSHAMGNSNGSLADYWDAIRSHHGLQGGFIWEWVEHGLPLGRTGPFGRPVWGYGGDFCDEPNDVNFVCDGLVAADREPHPALEEVRWVGRPATVEWAQGGRRLRITNRRWFTGLDDLRAAWSLQVDGEEVAAGELEVPEVAPGESALVARPFRPPRVRAGQEVHLTVTWTQRRAAPWAARGAFVAREQLEVAAPLRSGAAPAPRTTEAPAPGLPEGIDPFAATPTVFRALTDNDGLRQGWMRGLAGQLGRWVDEQGLDRCTWDPGNTTRRTRGDLVTWTSTGALHAPGVDDPVVVRRRVEQHPDGWVLLQHRITLPPALEDPPRVGIEWVLPGELEQLEWYGDGPHECYPDRRAAATVGRWSTTVSDTYVDHVVPQEHGHRTGLRWLALRPRLARRRSVADGLLVVADPSGGRPGFAARHHPDSELWAARHTDDLHDPASPTAASPTVLYLDAAQRGLGTASCGPDALERYRIGAGTHVVTVWCRALAPWDDAAALAAQRRLAPQ